MDHPPLTQEPVLNLDSTPDEGYPVRILKAHLENCKCHYQLHGLQPDRHLFWSLLNQAQEKRAKLLEAAITKLERP